MSSDQYSGYSSYYNFGDGLKKKIIIVSVASVVLLGLILGFLFGSGALTTDGDDGGDVRGNLEGKCEILKIDKLRPPQSGQVVFEKDEKIELDCIRGFSIFTEELVRTCGDNGKFIPSLENSKAECKPDCPAPDYKNYRRPSGVFKFIDGYRLYPECLGGFFRETAVDERLCTNGKFEPNFSEAPVLCTQDCPSPTFVNFLPPDEPFLEGYTLELKCEDGYSIESDEIFRTCQDTKFVPGFDPADPHSVTARCLKDCSRPDFDNYAGPDGSTPSGGTVNLKCKDGYGLNTDSQERLCTNGNYFPDFVNSPAACLQICPKPTFANFLDKSGGKKQDLIVNGKLSKEYVEGFDLTLDCDEKFSLQTNAVERKCQEGQFNPSFDKEPAECYPDCEQPSNFITKYSPIEEKLTHGYVLNLKCPKPRWIKTKTNRRVCKKGEWEPHLYKPSAVCVTSDPRCETVKTACECRTTTGHGNINMGGITLKKDVPTFSTSVGSYKYFFNPCVGFAIGDGDGKVHSITRRKITGVDAGTEKGLGSQQKSAFGWNIDRELYQAVYISYDEQASSNIALICNDKVPDHTFNFIRKEPTIGSGPAENWIFEFEGPCLCSGRC